jgi:hypothetical protein
MIYIAYEGFSQSGSREKVVDADSDLEALRTRVNAYYAQPRVVDFHRMTKMEIPEGKLESIRYHCWGGGGGGYTVWIEIREQKPLELDKPKAQPCSS